MVAYPDSSLHNPDAGYIYGIVLSTMLCRAEVARRVGVSRRELERYISGDKEAPYAVQYAIESLCRQSCCG